jgi:N-acetylneuraminic acid mutarotase
MHVARSGLGVAVVNGKIYAIGGKSESGVVGTNEEYDPETDTWTYKASMPTPRQLFAVAVYQNKIYCIGGTTDYSSYSDVNEVYDPATNTWTTRTRMPTARLGLQANVINDKIYLIGGLPYLNRNEAYDPAKNTWKAKTPLPNATGFVSTVINNKIYAVGTYFNGKYISTTQIYDPDMNAWTKGSPPPTSINGGGYSVAAATSGKTAPTRMYIFGKTPGTAEQFVNVYDTENASWTFGADPPTIRNFVGIGVVNDIIYVIGGYYESPLVILTQPDSRGSIIGGGNTTYYAAVEAYTPFGYGTVSPEVFVVSPENMTYNATDVSLVFTLNKLAVWIGYSLDGHDNTTVTGNSTITELINGLHNITVYAKDTFGNEVASETITFAVEVPKPFPTVLIVIATIGLVAGVGAGLLFYFKKRKN